MMKTAFFILLSTTTLLLAAGCSQEQLASMGADANDANGVVTAAHQTVQAIHDSPAGALIPDQVYQIMEVLGVGLSLALAIWKSILASGLLKKNSDLVTTLRAVADGVTAAGPDGAMVKAKIREIMRDREVYSVANPIVDQVKSKPAGEIS